MSPWEFMIQYLQDLLKDVYLQDLLLDLDLLDLLQCLWLRLLLHHLPT